MVNKYKRTLFKCRRYVTRNTGGISNLLRLNNQQLNYQNPGISQGFFVIKTSLARILGSIKRFTGAKLMGV